MDISLVILATENLYIKIAHSKHVWNFGYKTQYLHMMKNIHLSVSQIDQTLAL